MNEGNYREYGGGISCYFHPKEVVVGVCHLCLNERLVIIAAKQGSNSKTSKFLGSKHKFNSTTTSNNNSSYYNDIPLKYHSNNPKSYISLPKFFGIGSFFNAKDIISHHRHHRRSRKSNHDLFDIVVDDDVDTTSTSLEDESFISIKFGDNGVASWDKTSTTTVSKEPIEHSSLFWRGQTAVKDATLKSTSGGNHSHKCVVEHPKPRPSMRWLKRIGQLFQVIKWKKSSSKANAGGSSGERGNNNNNMVVRNNKTYVEDISMSEI